MFKAHPRFDRIIVSSGLVGDTSVVDRWRRAIKGRKRYYLSSEAVVIAHHTPLPPAQPVYFAGDYLFSDDYE